ncbi:MAG TPA: bifunctional diguanylate cyclase/phosphodiesterase [Actinophytocola sp.]|uniref:putative bifunctional diguanylate cyclase/phosphodiesterase n=1 Tax=Actinophytocola sp. TaxID=1872138 RepID=UPI002DDDAD9B|nr:bifunctional diguanylate cyclase/phosphodiesterase [Actinophytocola sp.]HEV2778440.1 bifunctional diguanylate cyclase/phosphodiesterase [Actinophytocola sp.]
MSEPTGPHHEAQRDTAGHQDAVAGEHGHLVRTWLKAVVQTAFVPGGSEEIKTVLDDSLRQLAAALDADPFDAGVGYRVGAGLVAAQISSPEALGATLTLLGERLVAALGPTHREVPARLPALLGQLAAGYTESMRRVALAAAEDINRAERVAWRDRQKMLQLRLQRALLCEQLTGLPNRARLTSWLSEVMTDSPNGARLGMCLINLDRFKAVNDNLGHDNGDRLLRAVARRLRAIANRSGDFLAHLGRDEFAIVVKNTTGTDDVAKVADHVLRALREPVNLNGHRLAISASAGIVEHAAGDIDPEELLRTAEITLGWAKNHYRGRWTTFDPGSYASEVHRHAMTAAMPAALARGEFTVAYQPLVRLADRRIVGVEALARWQHPIHGLIGPAHFIPLAESTGLITQLGLFLLEQACRQAVVWQREHDPILISVNLSVAQLRDPDLPAAIMATLGRTGLRPHRLQLEITESAIVDTGDTAAHSLRVLARSGIQLAIDDFGTGYSSLAYLADLPVHAVKLAPNFLQGIDDPSTGHSNSTILPALISLSHDLDLTVTAEGIETPAQAHRLTTLGCDLGQGFHLGRPTTAEHISIQLARNPPDNRPATGVLHQLPEPADTQPGDTPA